jgi:hypothetical protein
VQKIKDDLDRLDKASGPGWPRRRCHVDMATTARIRGATIVDMAHGVVRVELRRRNVYSGGTVAQQYCSTWHCNGGGGWRGRHQKKWWLLGQRPGGVRQPLRLAQRKDQALITMLVERDCHGIR